MPLNDNAEELIRKNLRKIRKRHNVHPVAIGVLTEKQLADMNAERAIRNMDPLRPEVVFRGKHIYESRIVRNGYTVDDVIEQIRSAMDAASIVTPPQKHGTTMQNPNGREDAYGNTVNDEAVFECTSKFPRPELFSVIPRGDNVSPEEYRKKERDRENAVPETIADLPG